jgi:ribosomal protein S18 acetylase RimI-like enzyme
LTEQGLAAKGLRASTAGALGFGECTIGLMRIVPLRDRVIGKLEPVFEEEIRHWDRGVFWDYRTTLRVIKSFIASGNLPGFALLENEELIGYSYFVVDRPVAFIGNVYVRNDRADAEPYGLLIERTVTEVTGVRTVERVEAQVFEFNHSFKPLFDCLGFQAMRRYFLVKVLDQSVEGDLGTGSGWQIAEWQDKFLAPAAEVVYDSYFQTYDASLCRDYQTRQGCLRFLRNLIENPACGRFWPSETLVALDRLGRVCGLLLATRTQEQTGMIPQISIRRDCQGRGLGTRLMRLYLANCRRHGLARVTLSVSEANERAFRLYRRIGFEVQKSFYAFVWERQGG